MNALLCAVAAAVFVGVPLLVMFVTEWAWKRSSRLERTKE